MFLPAQVEAVLPFAVPPLHARFLGAMYLSGATFMILGLRAETWPELRVVLPMVAIWTGMLGLVSFLHLEAFDAARTQTWVWFAAYIAYPIIAAWIAWKHRAERDHPTGPPLSVALRRYLQFQGAVVAILALGLLLAPTAMAGLWPWKISPLLAQIYSAPFLSYGLGSLYAARQQVWPELRIVVYATLVFSLGVFLASLRHVELFDLGAGRSWLWFASFGLSSLALAAFAALPGLREGR
jgi:hypothetical protein